MNQQMWAHLSTLANVATLRARGAHLLGPASGAQACGDVGAGRMLEPAEIIDALEALFSPQLLKGKRVLVNAGPTLEDLDPVRYIGNRSSGQMGFEIARGAAQMGAQLLSRGRVGQLVVLLGAPRWLHEAVRGGQLVP